MLHFTANYNIICINVLLYTCIADTPLSNPSPPTNFSLSARNEIARFDITSATPSDSEITDDDISAFIFEIKEGIKLYYIVQVRELIQF